MTRSEKDKMLAGDLYDPSAAELRSDQAATNAWLARLNTATTMSMANRRDILAERFAAVGVGVEIRSPFHCDYGFNISVGSGAFLNFNCVILAIDGRAGSVVTRNVPAGATVYGNPARIKSDRE
jgi:maltose O-acetyltransferase